MAVKIRLSRTGRKNIRLYRIVATDKESPRDGKVLEVLGHYDPAKKENVLTYDKERLSYWLSKGAKCTDTLRNLLKKAQ